MVEDNTAARALYRTRGYVEIGEAASAATVVLRREVRRAAQRATALPPRRAGVAFGPCEAVAALRGRCGARARRAGPPERGAELRVVGRECAAGGAPCAAAAALPR